MTGTSVTILLAVLAVIFHCIVRSRRHRQNLDGLLRPMVEAHGLQLINSRSPSWFSTGPFPLVTGEVGNLQTEVLGISGEYWTYRIVRVRSKNQTKEVWVRLYFEAFQLLEAEWRPSLTTLASG